MKSTKFLISLLLLISSNLVMSSPDFPVIAIYANAEPDISEMYTADKVNVNYVRWLESAGAEVIVIHTWYTQEMIEDIMNKANGILFQGGARNLNLNNQWEKNAEFIFTKAKEMNKQNKVFPLWFTCQGFELVHALVAGTTDVLTEFDSWNMASPLTLEKEDGKMPKMFADFTNEELLNLERKDVTAQFHRLGISIKEYTDRPDLNNFFKITSLGRDRPGRAYVASVEAREYPFYAVQFHPEKTPFDRKPEDNTPQSLEAIEISQRFSEFFVNEARKSKNDITDAEKAKYDYINSFEKGNRFYDAGYYVYQKGEPAPSPSPVPVLSFLA